MTNLTVFAVCSKFQVPQHIQAKNVAHAAANQGKTAQNPTTTPWPLNLTAKITFARKLHYYHLVLMATFLVAQVLKCAPGNKNMRVPLQNTLSSQFNGARVQILHLHHRAQNILLNHILVA